MGVGAGLYMCDLVKKKFTFAISSPGEFLSIPSQEIGLVSNVSEIIHFVLSGTFGIK